MMNRPFASRLSHRWLKSPAVLRRRNVVVWQGKVDVAPAGSTNQGRMLALRNVSTLNWEISFPVGTDVRVNDEVIMVDEEYTVEAGQQTFEIVADGGPFTAESVLVTIGIEVGRNRG